MIIANTFPKSGTGLLRQILKPFGPDLGHASMYHGRDEKKRTTEEMVEILSEARKEDGYITAHFHWDTQTADALGDTPMIMLVRDPRDVIVSHAKYVFRSEAHHLHKYYRDREFKQSLIMTSMVGVLNLPKGEFPDIARRFTPYLGWMQSAYILHFEDLIQRQEKTVEALAAFLGDATKATQMIQAIDPSSSFTFRKAAVGDWEEEFSDEEKEYFNKRFSWLLPLMGYGEAKL